MNKKAQQIMVGIMIMIIVFIALVQFIEPLKTTIIQARNPSNLDCENSSISVGQRGTCILVDLSLFYYFGVAMAGAAGFVGVKWWLDRK